ncbi:MAG: TRAP transporter small permease [Ramlibacter sp.]|jgi:TRAP-type C4-dicarboxylate transport system permease small subunit|nr:TRAP transporter small permease [Ramlibacter sp.]
MNTEQQPTLGRVGEGFLWLAGLSLVAMVVVIGTEVVARSVFHYSFEVVDELGGYLLVALSFLSLAPALKAGAFHRVELVQQRLSPRGKRISRKVFLVLSLAFGLIMSFTIGRYVWRTFSQGEVASTGWQTPLWIPMLPMLAGIVALTWVLAVELIAHRGGEGGHDA